ARELDPAGRPGRPGRDDRPPAPVRPGVDAAHRGRAGVHRARGELATAVHRRQPPPLTDRTDGPKPRLQLICDGAPHPLAPLTRRRFDRYLISRASPNPTCTNGDQQVTRSVTWRCCPVTSRSRVTWWTVVSRP